MSRVAAANGEGSRGVEDERQATSVARGVYELWFTCCTYSRCSEVRLWLEGSDVPAASSRRLWQIGADIVSRFGVSLRCSKCLTRAYVTRMRMLAVAAGVCVDSCLFLSDAGVLDIFRSRVGSVGT